MKTLLFCMLGLGLTACGSSPKGTNGDELAMLIGTYTNGSSKGIYTFRFNQETGTAVPLSSAALPNPSYLVPSEDGEFVYAVSEMNDSTAALSSLAFDRETGELALLSEQKMKSYSISLEDAESVTLSNLCCSYAFTEQNGQVTETVTIKADGKYQGNRELLQKTKHRDEKLEDLHTDSQDENALLEVEAEIEQTLEEKMDAMTEKLQQNQNADGTNSYYKLGAYARDIYLQFQKDWSGYRKNLTVEYHWDVTLVTSP